jgi:hypothetical protein
MPSSENRRGKYSEIAYSSSRESFSHKFEDEREQQRIDRFLAKSGWKSSILTLLGSGHITCMNHTNCRVYNR